MRNPKVIAYKGPTSQTGLATKAEFPGLTFGGLNESFEDIGVLVSTNEKCALLPVWNSHDGEIRASKVLSLLFDKNAHLYRLWPSRIDWHLVEKENLSSNNVVSVMVAESQCSKLINDKGFEFIPKESTVDALKLFDSDHTIAYAILAPGQNKQYKLITENAANPLNFTTFGLLGGPETASWGEREWSWIWSKLKRGKPDEKALYFGIDTAVPSDFSQGISILDEIAAEIQTLDEIPSLLLAAKSEAGRCRLLFESKHKIEELPTSNDDEYQDFNTFLISDIGSTREAYASRINAMMSDKFGDVFRDKDFICHHGTKTCFYACPALGIMTHGFDITLIENLVKQLVGVFYRFYFQGLSSSKQIGDFLKKYENSYNEKGIDFVAFENIGA